MFHLFGKKKEEASAPKAHHEPPQHEAVIPPDGEFGGEDIVLLAVTGPNGFGRRADPATGVQEAGIQITAWTEEDSGEIHRGTARLVAPADLTLEEYLAPRLPRDFLIKVTVRPEVDGDRFLMVDLPVPGFEPELKAILEEQKEEKKLVTQEAGTFVLNRGSGLYQRSLPWGEDATLLSFSGEEEQAGCLRSARALLDDPTGWDRRIKDFAVNQLLPLARDWAAEDEEVEEADLLDALFPDTVVLHGDGRLDFWFGDGGVLWGHSVCVEATLTDGPVRLRELE